MINQIRPTRAFKALVLVFALGCGSSAKAPDTTKNDADTGTTTPCTFNQLLQCNDGNPCTQDRCQPNTFDCVHDSSPMNGLLCDPQNNCIEDAACSDGACVATLERTCVSIDPCAIQTCDPVTGNCIFSEPAPDGTECQDGDACTIGETCDQGNCAGGTPLECDDDDPCTIDTCNPKGSGCVHDDIDGGNCDDDNPCTLDSCNKESGECTHESAPLEGESCNPGNPCKGEGTCNEGTCDAPTIVSCDDENPCTWDICDPETGTCAFQGTPMNGTLCNDGNPCTDKDRCNQGVCKPGPTKSCNDFNPCTQDVCYQLTACCSNSALVMNNVPCDDGNPCTETGSCNLGTCAAGAPIEDCCLENSDCNDNDPCTENVCQNNHCFYLAIPPQGCCGETQLKKCFPGGISYTECTPDSCGWDGTSYGCDGESLEDPSGLHPKTCPAASCIPQCGSNECGPDGCGGTCGTCGDNEVCGQAKLCIESQGLSIDFSDPAVRTSLDPNDDGIIEEETEVFLSNGIQLVVTTEANLTSNGVVGSAPFCFEGISLVMPAAVAWATQPHQIQVRAYNQADQLNETGQPQGIDVTGLGGKISLHYWADELFSQTEVSEVQLPYWGEGGPQTMDFESPATLRLIQLHFGENGTEYEAIYIDINNGAP